MRSATRRIRSASDTEDPPYFCTTSATVKPFGSMCEDPTKNKGFAHPIYSAGSVRMWPSSRRPDAQTRVPIHPRHRRALEPADVRRRRGADGRAARRGPGGRALGRDVGAPPAGALHRRACAATRPSPRSPTCSSAATATRRPPGALILVCADEGEDERTARYAAVDAGAAIAQLTIEAVSRGLIAHPMAGFNADGALRGVRHSGRRCGPSPSSRSVARRLRQGAAGDRRTRRAGPRTGCRSTRSRSRAAGESGPLEAVTRPQHQTPVYVTETSVTDSDRPRRGRTTSGDVMTGYRNHSIHAVLHHRPHADDSRARALLRRHGLGQELDQHDDDDLRRRGRSSACCGCCSVSRWRSARPTADSSAASPSSPA